MDSNKKSWYGFMAVALFAILGFYLVFTNQHLFGGISIAVAIAVTVFVVLPNVRR